MIMLINRRIVYLLLQCIIIGNIAALTAIKPYSILSSSEITEELYKLAEFYPEFVTLKTTQEEYGLERAGSASDCQFDPHYRNGGDNANGGGCYNYYLTIQDYISHPTNSTSSQHLPEVFLSGAVHGNERVGPTTVVETAKLLIESAFCESLPHIFPFHSIDINTEYGSKWLLQVEKGNDCRKELYNQGISDNQRQWLARLVSTRRIVIIPTANALGYHLNKREEGRIDPNRDFPFDVIDKTRCMQTIAGRSINELFREHLFQIALTFHGGMEVVSYEWGAPTYSGKKSPDDLAQVEIGDGYARFAGGFQGTSVYTSGTMNSLVYPVRGGMEDWAYAGSWDPDRVIKCEPNPSLYGPYSPEKTTYNDSQLRAFNMLIETSNSKFPSNHLGTSESVLAYSPSYSSNGHISRNIRLSLMAIDIVEPYVTIRSVNKVKLTDDVVPSIDHNKIGKKECQQTKLIGVPSGTDKASISWTVGGGFTVDFTNLYYAHWDEIDDSVDSSIGCNYFMSKDISPAFRSTEGINGITRWHKNSSNDDDNTTFSAIIDISDFRPGDKIAIFATVRLDQGWKEQPNKEYVGPNVPPMSHVVNARTNDGWRHINNNSIIQGRKDWFSIPLTIQISDELNDIIELSNRFTIPDIDVDVKHDETNPNFENGFIRPIGFIILSLVVTFALYRSVRRLVFGDDRSYTVKRSFSDDIHPDDDIELPRTEFV